MAGRRRVGSSVLRGRGSGARRGGRTYARDARGRFAATPGGPTDEPDKRRARRRAAAGITVAVGAGAAAAGASRARSAPTRRQIQRAHERRVYRDLGKMALHRGGRFDVDAARKLARAEYRGIRKTYRKDRRSDRRSDRKYARKSRGR